MSRKVSIVIPLVAVAAALVIAVVLTVIGGRVITDIGERAEADTVRSVGSSQELSRIVVNALRAENSFLNRMKEGLGGVVDEFESLRSFERPLMAVEDMARPESAGDSDASAQISAPSEFSNTNVQVDGVDEADIIKTDGRYIYQVNRDNMYGGTSRLVIVDAVPGSDMEIVSTIDFPSGFNPQDIYVADGKLVVVGHDSTDFTILEDPVSFDRDSTLRTISPDTDRSEQRIMPESEIMIMPEPIGVGSVRVHVYGLSNIEEPSLIRDTAVEGRAVSTRRIGDILYVISSSPMIVPSAHRQEAEKWFGSSSDLPEIITPGIMDSATGEEPFRIDYADVQYARGEVGASYITVAGISISDPGEPASVTSVLGSAENVFSTENNMYVSFTQYSSLGANESTKIYRFALDNGEIEHTGVGNVAGRLLNQFSMDEYEDNLRVVTTEGNWEQSENHLFVLGDKMQVIGSLKGFGSTESVFSARFIGDRAYVVTFRQTDPFFVIDVGDPTDPTILGELKIPGFSNYLHPYDENHVIGFGKDATESGSQRGMKMAMFDVTDVENPKEVAKEIIGDSGTHSPLLDNHRALLFDRERELLVFPVTVNNNSGQGFAAPEPFTEFDGDMYYGPEFQGAYVYKINSEIGFQLQGRLTHYSADERPSEHMYGNRDGSAVNKDVQRALYINETLYTVSQGMVMANELGSLDVEGTVEIPSDM